MLQLGYGMKFRQGLRRYLAELVGTFALVFCGTGAIVINQETGGTVTHVGIAITFGLVILIGVSLWSTL